MQVLPPIVIVFYDTSLGAGRLSADWVPTLNRNIRTYPEAIGPVRIHNMGHGGWTSANLLAGAGAVAALNPTHIIFEGGAINDCYNGGSGPAVSRAQHIANIQAMVALWRAANPAVDLTIMTMSSVSAIQTGRATLADYYADELAVAATLGIHAQDNYSGWPKPLALGLTNGSDATATPWGAGTTLNPADKSASVTLSDGNLTMVSAADHAGVRATTSESAGRFSFTAAVNALGDGAETVGLATASASLAGDIGTDAYGYGFRSTDGAILSHGTQVAVGPWPWNLGDVIGVDADFTLGKVWLSYNNAWFNGDPKAGLGGLSIAAGTYLPAFSASNGGSLTADFTDGTGDGLHPLWTGAVDTYLYPNVLALVRAKMAAYWAS